MLTGCENIGKSQEATKCCGKITKYCTKSENIALDHKVSWESCEGGVEFLAKAPDCYSPMCIQNNVTRHVGTQIRQKLQWW